MKASTDRMSSDQVAAHLVKTYGPIGGRGVEMPEPGRYNTGVLAFDVATGGGIPKGRLTLIYGRKGSCKTNFALLCIASQQYHDPHLTAVFIDIEGTVTEDWARALGVDWDRLIYLQADTAEQATDIAVKMIAADDTGVVVLDSIAMMSTNQEVGADFDAHSPGTHGRAMGKFIRLANKALKEQARVGGQASLICINQIRQKIGVMFGSPDTLPGGMGQEFMASLAIRLHGKAKIDAKINPDIPAWRDIIVTIEKNKVPIVQKKCELSMAMIPIGDLSPGQANDWPAAKRYMEELGLMERLKGGAVRAFDQEFKNQAALWAWLRANRGKLTELTRLIISERSVKLPPQLWGSSLDDRKAGPTGREEDEQTAEG